MASEIYPVSISSISFITVINIIMVYSILHEVSSPKIGERQWNKKNKKSCCPLRGPQNATHSREEDYIRVDSALVWREEHFITTSGLEGEEIHPRTCGDAKFWSVAKIPNFNDNYIHFLEVEFMRTFGVQ